MIMRWSKEMKKTLKPIKIMIFIVMMSLLVGCNSKTKQKVQENVKEKEESTVDAVQSKKMSAFYQYEGDNMQTYWQGDDIKKVENGYYYINNKKLYFFETEMNESFVVCSSPDCNHEDEQCCAYVGEYGENMEWGFLEMGMEVTDAYIYMLGYEQKEVTDVYLYRIRKDGTLKEKVCYLYSTDDATLWYPYKMHQQSLYQFWDNGEECYLEKIDLEGHKEIIYDVSNLNKPVISNIAGYGEYVYFDVTWYTDAEQKQVASKLYRYHTKTKEVEEVLKEFVCNTFQLIDEDTILYMDISYNILKMDMTTNQTTNLILSSGNYFPFSYDGIYMYIENINEGMVDVYDLDGNKLDSIDLLSGECAFGDSEYLFVRNVISDNGEELCWYVLSKNQIGTSEKQWVKLEN